MIFAAVSLGSKLRYPLRSSARSKAAAIDDSSESSSVSRRVRPPSNVSQSMDVLDLSAKDKSTKPPRRLSIPTKSAFSPRQASVGSITPLSDVSKSSNRRKFNLLSSVSYWLAQIKLSESASKHSVSLGFFKLALDSGCEPLQRMREELKSYVRKHSLLTVLGETAKDVLQSYNILEEEFEQLKLSSNSPQSQEGNLAPNKNADSSSASTGDRNLKPKSLISKALTVSESNKKDTVEKRVSAAKNRASNIKNTDPGPVKDANISNIEKKPQKPRRVESNRGNAKIKSSTKEPVGKKVDPMPTEAASSEDKDIQEDKENMDCQSMDVAQVTGEEIQAI
ncbi:uncharacterized protein A4U43_C06F8150 [Asparagus officinalis]|uniref:Uncharacterized protein n=1 Tax=Asparagus officinalis TaxID=4686 RepID=A0A5P1ENS2_ASPOF|nr:uncharacterized protein LOC109845010 [Asparagus officinalis]ONK66449.1 uncharacterized protein A4U43_C06F8150 [Asparagus officinalis]